MNERPENKIIEGSEGIYVLIIKEESDFAWMRNTERKQELNNAPRTVRNYLSFECKQQDLEHRRKQRIWVITLLLWY